MSKKFIVEFDDEITSEQLNLIIYLGNKEAQENFSDQIPKIRAPEVTEIVNHEGRMTFEQRENLWDLCGRYNVPFREDDYVHNSKESSLWIPISEGNKGSRIYRCTDCCEEIDATARKNSP